MIKLAGSCYQEFFSKSKQSELILVGEKCENGLVSKPGGVGRQWGHERSCDLTVERREGLIGALVKNADFFCPLSRFNPSHVTLSKHYSREEW